MVGPDVADADRSGATVREELLQRAVGLDVEPELAGALVKGVQRGDQRSHGARCPAAGRWAMAVPKFVETERKYQVDALAVVPRGGEDADPLVGEVSDLHLEAVYFDTPGLDLHRRGITLRRRTGGEDEGWHLKIPRDADTKTEVRHPLGRAVRTVPRKVVEPVRAIVRDRPLVPVAAITTHRTTYALLDHDEQPLALLCDDEVSARSLLDDGDDHAWREWELEVVAGRHARRVFESIEPALLAAGALRSDHRSKLGHAVAHLQQQDPSREAGSGRKGSVRALLHQRLVEQISALHTSDAVVRGGQPEGVHRMRIAARRLRSALTTTKPLFREPQDELLAELRWLGQVLSPARDAHVTHQRLETALEAEPADLVLGPARSRLRAELVQEQRGSFANAKEALDSPRYYRLLDALDALAADLPLSSSGEAKARRVMGDLVAREAKRLHRTMKAFADSDPKGRDAALHEVRKKAKRLRYAAELATPAGGRRATKLAKRAKAIQQDLGRHQDSVVARERLRQLGAQSHLHGENGFTFGLLYGLERRRAERARRDFEKSSARMPRPRTAASWVSRR